MNQMNDGSFYLALEQRLLFDAAGMATAIDTLIDHHDYGDAAPDDHQAQGVDTLLTAFAQQDLLEVGADSSSSLIFIDSRVENPEQLLGSGYNSANVYTIDTSEDGLAYIAKVLNSSDKPVNSLHIISHGKSGELQLGSSHIDVENIDSATEQMLSSWGTNMTAEADILFYGCSIAEGERGERFVEKFALLTGADIAASTNATGSELLGGDVELEFSVGTIETGTILDAAGVYAYNSLLGDTPPAAGGDVNVTALDGGAISITEDAASPGAANIRLTPSVLTDSDSVAPHQIRIIGISGGTLSAGDGNAITPGAAGTVLDLTAGSYDFRFTPTANRDTAASFTYVIVDADNNAINSAASTATISITPVNDAPSGLASVSLNPVAEDTTAPAGQTVGTLFGGAFADVDSGDSLGGIVVIANSADNTTQGSWQYSTNGTDFYSIGTVGDNASGLVLSSGTQLRFVPVADYNGTPTGLSARMLDSSQADFTSGVNRVSTDASAHGGSTAISSGISTVGVDVTAVNDAPELQEAALFPGNIVEDQNPNDGVLISTFLDGLVTDIDNLSSEIGLAITGFDVSGMSGAGGTWQYSIDGVTNWTDIGAVSNSNALLLAANYSLRFSPADNQVGSAEITYKAYDGSSGTPGSHEDLAAGDTSRVSAASFSSVIAVTAVNDDPQNPTPNAIAVAMDEQTAHVILNTELSYEEIFGAPQEQTAEQIVYQLDSLPTEGVVERKFGTNWIALEIGSLFSQSDVDAGRVRYHHTAGELAADDTDSFEFTVRDGAGSVLGSQSFNITIKDVNADLTLPTTILTVTERLGDEATDFSVLNISVHDADAVDLTAVVFTLKSLPVIGRLQLDSGAGFVDAQLGDTFSKADLNADKLRYIHDTTEPVGARASTTFTVDVTDGKPVNPSILSDQTITLSIQPRNDDPVVTQVMPTLDERASITLDQTYLDVSDVDSPRANFTYILTSNVSDGALFLNGVRIGVGSLFLQTDVDAGKLIYRHFGSDPDADPLTADDSFGYTLRDRDGATVTGTFGINVTPVDDSGGGGPETEEFVLVEGGTLAAGDPNFARTHSGTAYVVEALPSHGELTLDGVALIVGGSFTNADVLAGNVRYVHDDSETFTDSFTFAVDDNVGNVFAIVITPVNESPVIDIPIADEVVITVDQRDDVATDDSNAATLGDVENAHLITITELSGSDPENQPDSTLVYKVTSNPPGGTLKIWDGANYVELTNNSFTVQDVKDGKIAYFHNPDSEPSPATDKFTLVLTDGGAEPSIAKTINVSVTNVNDVPVTKDASFSLSEGGTKNLKDILNGKFDDPDADDTPANLTLIVTALPTHGAVLKNGVAMGVNDTFTKADLDANLITYKHDGTENFGDSFQYKAADDGAPSLESIPSTVSITVGPVNDDPIITVNAGIVLGDDYYEGETIALTAAMLHAEDADNTSTQVQFRITSGVANGLLEIGNRVLGVGSVFTLKDLDDGLLKYVHNGKEVLTDAFTYKVSDSGGATSRVQLSTSL